MKKVLVLAAAVALFATPALAGISTTAHNLGATATSTDEICVFCHTPHSSNTTVTTAPLWNRTDFDVDAQGWSTYSTTTLNAGTPATLNVGTMPLCFSCHDGSAAAAEIVNQPNTGNITDNIPLTTGNIAGDAAQLTNDHPVGITYNNALFLADGELHDPAGAAVAALIPNGIVECASCHDVHDNTNVPFLIMSNATSTMCLTCHNK